MHEVAIDKFVENARDMMVEASLGEFVKVRTGDGNAAVVINETEWTILCQALSICVRHPEWVEKI